MNGVPPKPHEHQAFTIHTFGNIWRSIALVSLLASVVLVIEILTKMRRKTKIRPKSISSQKRNRRNRILPFNYHISPSEREAWRQRNEAAANRLLWYKNKSSEVSMWNTRFRYGTSDVAKDPTPDVSTRRPVVEQHLHHSPLSARVMKKIVTRVRRKSI